MVYFKNDILQLKGDIEDIMEQEKIEDKNED